MTDEQHDRWMENNARMLAESAGNAPSQRGAEIALRRLSDIAKSRAHEWERANNSKGYAESESHRHRWDALERRRDDVEWELRFFYGARVEWPGLYPVIECADGRTILL